MNGYIITYDFFFASFYKYIFHNYKNSIKIDKNIMQRLIFNCFDTKKRNNFAWESNNNQINTLQGYIQIYLNRYYI